MALVANTATIVGLISGILALVFLVVPEIQPKASAPTAPPAKTAVRLKTLVVDPQVSRAQYLALTDQSRSGFTPAQLRRMGVFLRFRVTIDGFKGIPLTLRRELFDASTGHELQQESAITITPPANRIERDWHDWATVPERPGPFFVVVKLLARGEQAPLATLQTKRFPGPS